MYPRTVKVRSKSGTVNEFCRGEAYREGGVVKQRGVADLGRKGPPPRGAPQAPAALTGEDRDPADPLPGEGPTGADPSSFGPCSISWASGASATNSSDGPKTSCSPTALSCSSPTGSSPRPVSRARRLARDRLRLPDRKGRRFHLPPVIAAGGSTASIPASSTPGTVPSINSMAAGKDQIEVAASPPPRPLRPQARPGAL